MDAQSVQNQSPEAADKRQTSGRLRVPKMAVESADSLPVIGPILGDFGPESLQSKAIRPKLKRSAGVSDTITWQTNITTRESPAFCK